MKKSLIALLLVGVFIMPAVAQSVNTGASISSDVSSGLFTNERDAAFSAYEDSSGVGFSELGENYLFGGFDNGRQTTNTGSEGSFLMGYYHAAENPWSLYLFADIVGVASETTFTDDGTTETEYDQRLFSQWTNEIQFLRDFGSFTTGLRFYLGIDDLSPIASNYEQSGAGSDEETAKDITTAMAFTVPFFLPQGDKSHYFEVGLGYDRVNQSSSQKLAAGPTDDEVTDITSTFTPFIDYAFTMPLLTGIEERNELTLSTGFSYGFNSSESEDKDKIAGTTDEFDEDWDGDFSLNAAARQDIYFPTPSWLDFAIAPVFAIRWDVEQVGPVESTWKSTGFPSVKTKFEANHDATITIWSSYSFAAQVKPEEWFIGLMMGATSQLGYVSTTEHRDDGLVYTKDTTRTWFTDVFHDYGFFVPLPDGYRFEVTTSFNVLEFDQLRMQLNVPVNWK